MLHRIQEDSFRSWAQTRRSPSLANGPTSRSGWYFILISCSMTSPFARTLICHPLTKDILSRQRQEMITDTIDD